MITVQILINGNVLFARSARNTGNRSINKKKGTLYHLDTDQEIWHDPDLGAIPLAKQMLDTINPEMEKKF
jgi:hypothetical protein